MKTGYPKALAAILLTSFLLQGCAGVVIGAGVGAAAVANDRRTLGTQVDDKTLSARINSALSDEKSLDELASIDAHVFNGTVLLVGQAPNDSLKQKAQQIAASVPNVKKIHNQIRIGEPIPASSAANDTWLATKVKGSLIADERLSGLHVNVVVEDSEVFLMGLVNNQEAEAAVDVARNVNGVARVIKAFEQL